MSKYDGCFVKLANDPTFWAVDDGKKTPVQNAEHMHQIGIRPVHVVSLAVLKRIPLAREAEDEEE